MNRISVLLLIAGALIFAMGLSGLVVTLSSVPNAERMKTQCFVSDHRPKNDGERYAFLFGQARHFRTELADRKVEYACLWAAAGMALGVVLCVWALDRHRLLIMLAESRYCDPTASP